MRVTYEPGMCTSGPWRRINLGKIQKWQVINVGRRHRRLSTTPGSHGGNRQVTKAPLGSRTVEQADAIPRRPHRSPVSVHTDPDHGGSLRAFPALPDWLTHP